MLPQKGAYCSTLRLSNDGVAVPLVPQGQLGAVLRHRLRKRDVKSIQLGQFPILVGGMGCTPVGMGHRHSAVSEAAMFCETCEASQGAATCTRRQDCVLGCFIT